MRRSLPSGHGFSQACDLFGFPRLSWSLCASSLPDCSSLNPFLVLLSLKNRVHIDSPCMDVIRIERAEFYELLYLRNYVLGCRRHHGIKIPRCLPVNQISPAVALPRLDKREVPAYPALHHILSSIKLTRLFPLRHHCSGSGRRIKRRNPRSSRANPFRKGPLRIQLQLHLPARHQLLEQFILADVRRNHLPYLPLFQQNSDSKSVHSRIVRHNRQVLRSLPSHRRNQILWNPAQPKPAHQDRHPIAQLLDPHIRRRNPLIHAQLQTAVPKASQQPALAPLSRQQRSPALLFERLIKRHNRKVPITATAGVCTARWRIRNRLRGPGTPAVRANRPDAGRTNRATPKAAPGSSAQCRARSNKGSPPTAACRASRGPPV